MCEWGSTKAGGDVSAVGVDDLRAGGGQVRASGDDLARFDAHVAALDVAVALHGEEAGVADEEHAFPPLLLKHHRALGADGEGHRGAIAE